MSKIILHPCFIPQQSVTHIANYDVFKCGDRDWNNTKRFLNSFVVHLEHDKCGKHITKKTPTTANLLKLMDITSVAFSDRWIDMNYTWINNKSLWSVLKAYDKNSIFASQNVIGSPANTISSCQITIHLMVFFIAVEHKTCYIQQISSRELFKLDIFAWDII